MSQQSPPMLEPTCTCCAPSAQAAISASPTISHHLKVLREAGLIEGDRRGTWVFCRPVRGRLAALSALPDVTAVATA